jgi:hypothetical protein
MEFVTSNVIRLYAGKTLGLINNTITFRKEIERVELIVIKVQKLYHACSCTVNCMITPRVKARESQQAWIWAV